MDYTYVDPGENYYEDYKSLSPTGYISSGHKKSKRFYLLRCLGNKHRSGDWIYEPSKTNDYVNSGTIQLSECLVYTGDTKGPPLRDVTVHKEVQTDLAMADKTTQVPDVLLTTSDKSENSKKEGVISMSVSDSGTETRILESLKRNQNSVANIFDRYGLTLHSIEKGSIRFKFTIRSRDCDSGAILSDGNMRNLLREVCREALQCIPDGPGLDDITIEVELSSQDTICYNIAADVVQLGSHNIVDLVPSSDGTSPKPAACGLDRPIMYLNPTSSDPSSKTTVKTVVDQESSQSHSASGREKTMSLSEAQSPEPCNGNDSGFGSAPGGRRIDRTDGTPVKTVYQNSNIPQAKSVVTLQPRYSAHIVFQAPDKEKMLIIQKELYALKRVAFLEFDLDSDITSYCVKMCIFKRCVTVKDFYTSVVQFPVYPHLMTAITANMIDVTIEIPATTLGFSHYVSTEASPHDGTILFKARNELGMRTIIDELESMKSISSLKFEIQNGIHDNSVCVAVGRSTSPLENVFAEVLNFTTFGHLMEAIVDNLVDVKIYIASRDNSLLYDTFTLMSETGTEAEYKTLSDDQARSIQPKPKHNTSGLSRLFSSLRRSVRRRKTPV